MSRPRTEDDDDPRLVIDQARSQWLDDAGGRMLAAITAIAADGTRHFLVADGTLINSPSSTFELECPDAPHEQLSALPIEFVRRIAVAARNHRGTQDGGNR